MGDQLDHGFRPLLAECPAEELHDRCVELGLYRGAGYPRPGSGRIRGCGSGNCATEGAHE